MRFIPFAPLLIIFGIIWSLSSCTDETASKRTLDNAGFTEIELTGWSYFGCGKEDNFHTGFIATNPTGKRVQGIVCCGLWKSCTIRF